METSEMVPVPDPPSDNPLQYCRLCFSPFRIEPVFTSGVPNQHLLKQLSSLIQIELSVDQDGSCAICFMCQLQLEEFQVFRERCRLLDQSVKKKRLPLLPQSSPLLVPVPVKEEPMDEQPSELVSYQQPHSRTATDKDKDDELWFAVEGIDEEADIENGRNPEPVAGPSTQMILQKLEYDGEGLLNSNFWKTISRDVGVIPEHVRHSLELVGFCRNAALGQINLGTIKNIEQDMRDSVSLVADRESANPQAGMQKYYGAFHCNNPSQFTFFAGEVQTILSIARAVRENGISKYLRKSVNGQTTKQATFQPVTSAAEHAETLIKRIKAYYSARAEATAEYHSFSRMLDHIKIIFSREIDTGKHIAQVQCYLCTDKRLLRLSTDRQERFMVANFVKHCEIYHYKLPELPEHDPRRKRRRRAHDAYLYELPAPSMPSGMGSMYGGPNQLESQSQLQHQHQHHIQMQLPMYPMEPKVEVSEWSVTEPYIKQDYVELSDDD